MTGTKIFGHRGAKGSYPENTLIGFQKAIDEGVDGLEIDVHMTADGEIVVIHDERLDRTTDGDGYVKDLTLEEIKEYSAGSRFPHFRNYEATWDIEKVPSLQEVLELLTPYDIELNIELKTNRLLYTGIEENVLALVHQYGGDRKVIYSSFHLPTLLRLKALDESVDIALLSREISHPYDYIQTLGLEGLHLDVNTVLSNVHQLKGIFGDLRVWTANESNEIKQLLDLNVNAIITDFPEKAAFYKSERQAYA
ncbi:glycerophosphodiester phosphodiesterase [Salicibibacter kimchii]|uniref:Glycerophosphodiester phosphodiesterase n=1 Tax=Salicibibacter kimchii TaxID=2099786 RepID=A0A345BYC8_9BACI|nr:glycerophosphodiester phosphodiesterase [Salicibibacter kimchii]AXF55959.1 glycerophosphodiester phosphodiesterase [Salicibibacter kimchii]